MSPGRQSRGGSGKLSRRAALVLLGGGALASLSATGAFSSVTGPRPVNIGTASDDEALLRLTSGADGSPSGTGLNDATVSYSTHHGGTIELFEIANFLGENVQLTELSVAPDPQDPGATDLSISLDSPPRSVAFQQTKAVEATISCSNVASGESTGDVTVLVDITVEGESTSVTLQREITVECRNCVPCDSGTDQLVKYEWVESDKEDEDDDEEEDGDEDKDEGGSAGSFQVEGSGDANITHTDTTTDAEGEPIEATFETDYCAVDVVVKAGPNVETYENETKTITVKDINDKAISNVRFYCEAPEDVGMGSGGDDDGNDDDGDDDGSDDNPGQGNGNGNGRGSGSRGFDDD